MSTHINQLIDEVNERGAFHSAGKCPKCGSVMVVSSVLGYGGYDEVSYCDNPRCKAYKLTS